MEHISFYLSYTLRIIPLLYHHEMYDVIKLYSEYSASKAHRKNLVTFPNCRIYIFLDRHCWLNKINAKILLK